MARLTRSTCCCKRTCFQVEADAFPLRYQSYGNSEVIQVARRISQPLNIAQSAIDAVSKGRSSASTPIATATASHTPAEIYAKSHSSRPLTSAAAAAQTTRPVALSLNTTQNVPVDAASKGSRQYAAVAAGPRETLPPSSTEGEELHSMYSQYGQDDSLSDYERVWMGESHLEKIAFMFPQEYNVRQTVFGGYPVRLARELAFANASLFTRLHVTFVSLDGISFAKPVPIGSILRLTSQVLPAAPPCCSARRRPNLRCRNACWARADYQRLPVPKTYRDIGEEILNESNE
ncbi:hypothetical protein P692DRAFT_201868741 [Suillus brevipes Sb2]|nr:hypothetical protein P692DRAFT_201868741 [Suillus brevipes Sb2]